jgi:hypothetical protein
MRIASRRLAHSAVRRALGCSALLLAGAGGSVVRAQDAEAPAAPAPSQAADEDLPEIIVTGDRQSIVRDVAPIAMLDSNAIAASGASTIGQLLQTIRGVTQSADGSEPIFLLNAQRVSGYPEIGSLPPEAIDKVEVLPEPVALRFGYPPNRRVVNFITKRDFRQLEVRATLGNATEGGTPRGSANLGFTRLRKDGRLTLNLERRHTGSLYQAERGVTPDPDILFDPIGNVTGFNRGEIDPALSAAAGQIVTAAPVPESPAARTSLSGFAAGANGPRLFDLGPYRTFLPRNDATKAEAVIADRIGTSVGASLTLTAERSRDRAVTGPAFAILTVPETNPFSPFARPVLLHRYLTETAPLRFDQTTTKLHAGATLRGAVAGWRWDFTAALNQEQISGLSERGVDLGPATARIAAGADPFAPLDPALLATRLTDRSSLRTRTAAVKTVVTNTPVRLPAGLATVIATAEGEYAAADSSTRGPNPFDLSLSRSRAEAGLALDLPLASRREDVLAFVGELSLNASANARRVGGFGALYDTTLGLSWRPFEGVQFLVQARQSAAAPALQQLSTPVARLANIPVFDFRTGRTELVTLIQGGNPDLAAERRKVRSLAVNLKPFAKRELRIGATYEATTIRDQTGTVYAITPQTEALLPGLFVRDAAGRLVSVRFQPINFHRQAQHTLQLTVNANGIIGTPPAPPRPGETPGPPPVSYYAGMGPSIRFSDRLELRPGAPLLDLLDGDTVTGAGTARLSGYAYGGLNYRGHGMNFNIWYNGGNRVDSDNPAAALRFSPIFKLNVGVFLSMHQLLPKTEWTRKVQLRFEVDNVTGVRQGVRDGTGAVPIRLQPAYLDPVGRIARVSLRKMF